VVPPSCVFDERHGHRVLDLLVSIGQASGHRGETSGEIVLARFLKLGDREAENIGYKQVQEDLFVVLEVLLQARAKFGTRFDEVRNELISRQGHPTQDARYALVSPLRRRAQNDVSNLRHNILTTGTTTRW